MVINGIGRRTQQNQLDSAINANDITGN